ncbi:MAG TPA: hypothetical protein VGZ47_01875, partial [Gemmataceae bacterium]|nr:hypothetical protein [Gemmataceae bacterium]
MNATAVPLPARALLWRHGPRICVLSLWLLMTLLAARHIVRYGRNVPIGDDFALVPYWTGNEPVTLSYFWA